MTLNNTLKIAGPSLPQYTTQSTTCVSLLQDTTH